MAATSGFNAAGVLDATCGQSGLCNADNSRLLACEVRLQHSPSMFGTNDLRSLTPAQFDFYLRQVVVETVNAGVLPIVVTFPNLGPATRSAPCSTTGSWRRWQWTIGSPYLWRAFEPLPNGGEATSPDPGLPTTP